MLARAFSMVGGLRLAAVLVTLALAVPAVVFSAELVTAELDAPNNDVTVTQGGSANFDIKLSATGNISSAVTSASPATAKVMTSYALNAAGTLSFSTLSAAQNFWASSTGCSGGNCPITWTGAPTPYSVPASISAASTTPVGAYSIVLNVAAGTTAVTNPNQTGGKLEDTTATTITVHVVAPPDAAPSVTATTPANGATGVALDANISITFSESVSVTAAAFSISCASSGVHTATVSAGPATTFALNPTVDFANGELCTVTVDKDEVSDTDTNDPPNNMTADYVFSFTTVAAPVNQAPTANAAGPYSGNEGAAISLSGATASDPELGALTFAWTVQTFVTPTTGTCSFSNPAILNPSITCTDNGTATARLTVTDPGSLTASSDATVNVNNVAPSATELNAPATVNEGSSFALSLAGVTDPSSIDTATLQYRFDCGSGSFGAYGASNSASCPTTDDATLTARGQVKDKDGGESSPYSATVNVLNVAPSVSFSCTPDTVSEGGSTSCTYTFTDPGADTWTHSASCGATGLGAVLSADTFSAATKSGSFTCAFPDDNPTGTASDSYNVSVTVTDDDAGTDTKSASITVNNVAPVLGALSASPVPVAVGSPVILTGAFTDVGATDIHTCTVDWDVDDVLVTPVTNAAIDDPGDGSCSATKTFLAAGVYRVSMTVTDDDTGSDTEYYQYVVVYDPSAGFVTGGGWINVGAGSYIEDLTLTGKGTFGFVSKYQKGATTPTGNTEFQFHAAGMNFKSTSYQWLVVSGAKAQYKGVGTVNGVAGYGFLLTATDGQATGGGGIDKFRIKIWEIGNPDGDAAPNELIFDNVSAGSDDIDSANPQEIAQGSIVIHTKK